jgi:hypothetical protein
MDEGWTAEQNKQKSSLARTTKRFKKCAWGRALMPVMRGLLQAGVNEKSVIKI